MTTTQQASEGDPHMGAEGKLMMRGPTWDSRRALTQVSGILHSVPGVVQQGIQILGHGLRPAPRANNVKPQGKRKPRHPWNQAQSCLAPYEWLWALPRDLLSDPTVRNPNLEVRHHSCKTG